MEQMLDLKAAYARMGIEEPVFDFGAKIEAELSGRFASIDGVGQPGQGPAGDAEKPGERRML